MPEQKLTFECLSVGDRWVSERRQITAAEVTRFADLTGDHNPLHTDEQFARETPFGQPIAHGLLGLSYVAGLGSESPLLDTVAFLAVYNWRFLRPIYFGDTVRVRTEVCELEPNGRKRGRVVLKRALINQDDEVVQEGLFETLVARADVARADVARADMARGDVPREELVRQEVAGVDASRSDLSRQNAVSCFSRQ